MKFLRIKGKEEPINLIGLIKDDSTTEEFLERAEDMTGIEFEVVNEEEVDDDITEDEIVEKYGLNCITIF